MGRLRRVRRPRPRRRAAALPGPRAAGAARRDLAGGRARASTTRPTTSRRCCGSSARTSGCRGLNARVDKLESLRSAFQSQRSRRRAGTHKPKTRAQTPRPCTWRRARTCSNDRSGVVRDSDLGGQAGVVDDQAPVGLERAPGRWLRGRRRALAASRSGPRTPLRRCLRDGATQWPCSSLAASSATSTATGCATTTPALRAKPQCAVDGGRDRVGVIRPIGHRVWALADVEQREDVGPVADQRHAGGLEGLERGRDVEQRLRPGADDAHGGAGDLVEVGRDVERLRPSAVDAADSARAHEVDAGDSAHGQRPGDGRRAPGARDRATWRGRAAPPCARRARPRAGRAPRRRYPPGRCRRRPRWSPARRRARGHAPRRRGRRRARCRAAAHGRRATTRAPRPAASGRARPRPRGRCAGGRRGDGSWFCRPAGSLHTGSRWYTRGRVERRYRTVAAGHVRQPSEGRDRRPLLELRQADLPRLHGAGAGRNQVPRLRAHAPLGPRQRAAEGGEGGRCRVRGRLRVRRAAGLRRRGGPRVLHADHRVLRRAAHRPRHASRGRVSPRRGDGLDRLAGAGWAYVCSGIVIAASVGGDARAYVQVIGLLVAGFFAYREVS